MLSIFYLVGKHKHHTHRSCLSSWSTSELQYYMEIEVSTFFSLQFLRYFYVILILNNIIKTQSLVNIMLYYKQTDNFFVPCLCFSHFPTRQKIGNVYYFLRGLTFPARSQMGQPSRFQLTLCQRISRRRSMIVPAIHVEIFSVNIYAKRSAPLAISPFFEMSEIW